MPTEKGKERHQKVIFWWRTNSLRRLLRGAGWLDYLSYKHFKIHFPALQLISHVRNFSWDYILFLTMLLEKKGKVWEVICLVSLIAYGDVFCLMMILKKVSYYYTHKMSCLMGLICHFASDKIGSHVELSGDGLVWKRSYINTAIRRLGEICTNWFLMAIN